VLRAETWEDANERGEFAAAPLHFYFVGFAPAARTTLCSRALRARSHGMRDLRSRTTRKNVAKNYLRLTAFVGVNRARPASADARPQQRRYRPEEIPGAATLEAVEDRPEIEESEGPVVSCENDPRIADVWVCLGERVSRADSEQEDEQEVRPDDRQRGRENPEGDDSGRRRRVEQVLAGQFFDVFLANRWD